MTQRDVCLLVRSTPGKSFHLSCFLKCHCRMNSSALAHQRTKGSMNSYLWGRCGALWCESAVSICVGNELQTDEIRSRVSGVLISPWIHPHPHVCQWQRQDLARTFLFPHTSSCTLALVISRAGQRQPTSGGTSPHSRVSLIGSILMPSSSSDRRNWLVHPPIRSIRSVRLREAIFGSRKCL